MDDEISKIVSRIDHCVLNYVDNNNLNDSLFYGKLGLVFYSILKYSNTHDLRFFHKANDIINSIFSRVSNNQSCLSSEPSFSQGLTGLGYILIFMKKHRLIDDSMENQINVIKEVVLKEALSLIRANKFDFILGVSGILHFLSLSDDKKKCEILLQELYDVGLKNDFLFYNNYESPYYQGINFGLGQGAFGIISVCLEIFKKHKLEISRTITLKTLDKMVKFNKKKLGKIILTTGKIEDYYSYFPFNIISKKLSTKFNQDASDNLYYFTNRLGWCNGDLTRALIIHRVYNTFGNSEYGELAEELIDNSVKRRTLKDTVARNCFFCHGSSGIAFTYRNFFHETNEPIFLESYNYWIEITKNFMIKKIARGIENKDLQLVTGVLGSALVLMEHKEDIRFEWENIFLI